MFYRYEGRRLGQEEWLGICQALTPDHRRKIARFLKVPKWYNENPNIESESWFTQKGYDQYHERMEEIIRTATTTTRWKRGCCRSRNFQTSLWWGKSNALNLKNKGVLS